MMPADDLDRTALDRSFQKASTHPEDPRHQAHQLIADARRDFASDVDGILTELRTLADAFVPAVGDVSRADAWRALKALVLEKFDQRVPMRNLGDVVLVQLVRDADELLTRNGIVNARWQQTAKPFLDPRG